MTYEYQTEFTYVADTDPLTGAPVMTAIPQTVRAAKQGIPYNVLSSFGDLFKRETYGKRGGFFVKMTLSTTRYR